MGPVTHYSWVIPIRDESQSLPQLFSEIRKAMTGQQFEIIAVNDGSIDGSSTILSELARQISELRIIRLPRSYGKWAALRAGIGKSRGGVIITIDGDLQDDPTGVVKLLKRMHQGFDLVSGWRTKRQDPLYKIVISQLGNGVISLVSGHRFYDLNSPLKIFRREVLFDLPLEGSLFRFSLLFAYKMGYRVAEIPIRHRPRRFGRSKFGITKYLRILYDLGLVLLLFSGSGRIRNHVRIGKP